MRIAGQIPPLLQLWRHYFNVTVVAIGAHTITYTSAVKCYENAIRRGVKDGSRKVFLPADWIEIQFSQSLPGLAAR